MLHLATAARCLFVTALIISELAYARPIVLATSEVSPFSDSKDVSKGYVNEVVVKAFEELDEQLIVERYPHARAVMLAKKGALDLSLIHI